MNSSRLPNKVLYEINGKPLLKYLVERLQIRFKNKICLASSSKKHDDSIEKFCVKNNIPCFRGSLTNVAKRMLDTAKFYNQDAFVRINGDSPLMDPTIIEKAIKLYITGDYDLVTNVYPRSFPVGQSVEVIKTNTFKKIYNKMSTLEHFEHVTKYYYDYPEKFKIQNFQYQKDLSNYRFVVDTNEDINRMKKIIFKMIKPHTEYGLDKLIKLYPTH